MKKFKLMTPFLILCLILLTGCTNTFVVGTTIQMGEETCEVYSVKRDGVTYQTEKGLFSKERLLIIAQEMEEEVAEATEILAPNGKKEYTVRIVQSPPNGGMYLDGDVLYLRGSDVEHKRYIPWLYQMHYDLDDVWVAFGLYEYMNEPQGNEIDLAEYFDETKDLGMMGFFPARFVSYLNYESDYKVTMQVVREFFTYCLESDKQEALLNGEITVEDKQQWLASLGVKETYDGFEDRIFENYENFWSAPGEIHIELESGCYDIEFAPLIDNAREMEQFIVESIMGNEEGIALVKKYYDLDVTLPIINYDIDSEYRYIVFEDPESGDYTFSLSDGGFPAYYGMMLAYMQGGEQTASWKTDYFIEFWMNECMDELRMDGEYYYYRRMIEFEKLRDMYNNQQWENIRESVVWDEYSLLGLETSVVDETLDVRTLYDLNAIEISSMSIARTYGISNSTPIENLDVQEINSLLYYIADKYGKDVVVDYLAGGESLYDLTGKGETPIIKEWRAHLDAMKDAWYFKNREDIRR